MTEDGKAGTVRRGKADAESMRMVGRTVPGKAMKPARPGADGRRLSVRRNEALATCKGEFWLALPDVLQALIKGAKQGKATHLKMLLELGGLEPGALSVKTGRKVKEKSLADTLIEQWAKDKQDAAEDAAAMEAGAGKPKESGGWNGI